MVKIFKMNISQTDWATKLENDTNAIVLDVRTAEECALGMIPNAINIDIFKGQEFINEIETLDKTKNFYVYCKAGGRSEQACAMMNELGFEITFNLIGGFMQWQGEVSF